MSEALDYLMKARGDAVGHYFKFLKEAGKHLDPKTRALISLITKVDVQTETGFKQYLSRAMRDGCRPVEILDALLMAFPTLGLAKIVWATDILLEMNIPEFRPERLEAEPAWYGLIELEEIRDGQTRRIDCLGRGLFVHQVGGEYRVYDSRCPHQVTDIPHLALYDKVLTCPKHGWKFDLDSGDCIEKGHHPLRRFESKVKDGWLWVYC
ncbi:MAG: Rieske 2Fe-2S domain-containing protein [Pseudomonadota bacterium]